MKYKWIFIIPLFLISQRAVSQSVNHWEGIIEAADTWKYIIPVSEPPQEWTDPGFDDTSWLSGPGGFGYGDDDDSTQVPPGTISVYIRKSFTLANASDLSLAFLCVNYDDGFVAYLNGTEIARANIGTVGLRPAFNEVATNATEPPSASGNPPTTFTIEKSTLEASLKDGANILALQIHNRGVSSSDLSSGTFFIGGFSTASTGFRSPPEWFIPPPSYSSHLPLIVIDTWKWNIPNEPKIDAWMKVINNGGGQLNNTLDPGTDFEGYVGIEVRGQSSQMFPKKSYGFETRNELKNDSSVSLLGMPVESDWVLSASYSDKTMMRNPLSYYLGNRMGRWQPRTQWCEVWLNGDYLGIYALVEKIKRDKDRVNIDKLQPADTSGVLITGGYIVKVDKLDGIASDQYFRSVPAYSFPGSRNYDFTYVYPKFDEIQPSQKTYLQDFLKAMESALNGPDFRDPAIGYKAYIDQNSFIDFEIIQELSNNVDGYRFSTFFNKENISDGGKLVAGPLWDFDLCYGNVNYSPSQLATNTWLYTGYGSGAYSCMHWWARLMQDPDYKSQLKYRYSQLRAGPLDTDSVFAYLDSNQAYLGEAIDRNFQQWPILDQYVWPNPYIGYTYDNEMDNLKTWLSNRLSWLDTQWLVPLNNNALQAVSLNFKVYPNPFHSSLNLYLAPVNTDDVVVDIVNLQGQKLYSGKIIIRDTMPGEYYLDNINLSPGIYMLRAYQSGQIIAYSKLVRADE